MFFWKWVFYRFCHVLNVFRILIDENQKPARNWASRDSYDWPKLGNTRVPKSQDSETCGFVQQSWWLLVQLPEYGLGRPWLFHVCIACHEHLWNQASNPAVPKAILYIMLSNSITFPNKRCFKWPATETSKNQNLKNLHKRFWAKSFLW